MTCLQVKDDCEGNVAMLQRGKDTEQSKSTVLPCLSEAQSLRHHNLSIIL